jgi:sulfonate transport system substrate-binding protein
MALLFTAALGLLACAERAAAQAAPPQRLRIGYQKYGALVLLKARGALERRLEPLKVEVKWTQFSAGPALLEALNVGSIDFGQVGEAPPIFAQAAGADLVYVANEPAEPAGEAILVPKDSTIRSVAELKGKKIALNKGSNVHYFLVRALEKAGLKYGDVTTAFLPPADARAAFERGSVDAWVIWDPFLAAAQKTLEAQLVADASGVVNNRAYYFTSRTFADRNADVLKIAIEEINVIDTWASKNQGAAAAELSTVLGLDRSITDLYLGRAEFGTAPITRAILAEQQQIADTFFDLKLIPKKLNLLDAAPLNLG